MGIERSRKTGRLPAAVSRAGGICIFIQMDFQNKEKFGIYRLEEKEILSSISCQIAAFRCPLQIAWFSKNQGNLHGIPKRSPFFMNGNNRQPAC
jgi:hypothetical protein